MQSLVIAISLLFRSEELNQVYEKIEHDLEIIGAAGIEDKLQESYISI